MVVRRGNLTPHTPVVSWLSSLRSATSRVPLLSAGADYLYGLVDTSTAYYCYTSGSNESGGCNKDARVPLLLLFDIRRVVTWRVTVRIV
ncbi:hypothetical protein CHLRE_11g467748v5 [Chlamydomonas reinhardtii]|uniref:Uncharacterized protein n=1 Tax=Chlamydomonas reinhardtii TaxID=3055 RepID=A0A2K3D7W6_CHLRE|nr:uncharacterized protein CHLRE_11g467748v5 [Chlamydomonas reinhardtii]PNW76627.1 hypothetical protein CHLRE_11g467748v5 [Chlamydomonas reinhardtii]